MILGEKDMIVNNQSARDWHQNTISKVKDLKLMAGSFHELSKEPNNG
jgi:esterase/lipase